MFLENKYTKCYYSIINAAKKRIMDKSVYVEKHHIIPKSIGGDNHSKNIVILTAKEHFICHLLLTKMVEGENRTKMIYAIWRMTVPGRKTQCRHKVSANTYATIKKQRSEFLKSRTGESHPNYGRKTGRVSSDFTPEWKANLSKSATGRVSSTKGIPRSNSVKDAVSRANKGKPAWNKGVGRTDEDKQKIRDANTGKKWIFNPNGNAERKQLNPDECTVFILAGWKYGIGPRSKKI